MFNMDIPLLIRCIFRQLQKNRPPAYPIEEHVRLAADWLCRAQDITEDEGVSLRYSMLKGWDVSYPETTGYIIETLVDCAEFTGNEEYRSRAGQMAEWELSIQNDDGSFNGGALGCGQPPVVFDTGQIIFGLLVLYKITKENRFLEGAVRAASWLASVQDKDGKWSKYMFRSIPATYCTRVAWAVCEAGIVAGDNTLIAAARKNIDWALKQQRQNGWIHRAGFTEKAHFSPYTHTIAYAIRGILETGIALKEERYIESAAKAANSLLNIMGQGVPFAGTYSPEWRPSARYSCLTGNSQIAIIFFKLYDITSEKRYFEAGRKINRFMCQRQHRDLSANVDGAIPGSYPIWGTYQKFAFPNWATKFFIDALLMEKKVAD